MLFKALLVVIGLSILCRWALGQWPWALLQGAPRHNLVVLQARKLLGVGAGAGRDEIITAHRRLTALVHPDKGGTTAAMQEANAARDVLLAELPGAPIAAPDDDRPPPSQD